MISNKNVKIDASKSIVTQQTNSILEILKEIKVKKENISWTPLYTEENTNNDITNFNSSLIITIRFESIEHLNQLTAKTYLNPNIQTTNISWFFKKMDSTHQITFANAIKSLNNQISIIQSTMKYQNCHLKTLSTTPINIDDINIFKRERFPFQVSKRNTILYDTETEIKYVGNIKPEKIKIEQEVFGIFECK